MLGRRARTLAPLALAALLAGCSVPKPYREFPDVPAYPEAALQKRDPADTGKPARMCAYRVRGYKWLEVRKFYLRWMPKYGWKLEESPTGDNKDPNLYFSKGNKVVTVDPSSYSEQEQVVVFIYPREEIFH